MNLWESYCMKKTDIIVQLLSSDIKNKRILEVACGGAGFSISAAHHAHSVSCIDIDNSRVTDDLPNNVYFKVMDAAQMDFLSNSFDTVILYNAFSHIYSQWDSIKDECMHYIRLRCQMNCLKNPFERHPSP